MVSEPSSYLRPRRVRPSSLITRTSLTFQLPLTRLSWLHPTLLDASIPTRRCGLRRPNSLEDPVAQMWHTRVRDAVQPVQPASTNHARNGRSRVFWAGSGRTHNPSVQGSSPCCPTVIQICYSQQFAKCPRTPRPTHGWGLEAGCVGAGARGHRLGLGHPAGPRDLRWTNTGRETAPGSHPSP
jgi:hypothetical protein